MSNIEKALDYLWRLWTDCSENCRDCNECQNYYDLIDAAKAELAELQRLHRVVKEFIEDNDVKWSRTIDDMVRGNSDKIWLVLDRLCSIVGYKEDNDD